MKCPHCGFVESRVIDSRSTDEFNSIRRRRECMECGKRFTTYETIEIAPLLVIKNDGTRQPFDPAKIKRGMMIACEKRPIGINQIDEAVADIEKQIANTLVPEVSSKEIGELVMKKLKDMDEISYIRFACVYKKFADVSKFRNFLETI